MNSQIIAIIDGDGQMSGYDLVRLLEPLVEGNADYVKGNRVREYQGVKTMPLVRQVGNMVLSFWAKASTGYWNCFDPTNGFGAVRGEILLLSH